MYETEKLLNSVETTCKRTDLGRTTIYELLKSGRLQAVKVGAKTLIPEASLQKLMAELSAPSGKAA